MTFTSNPRHENSEASEPGQGPGADEGPSSEAEQMNQAALASMHPDLHEFDWHYYHNALQM